MILLTSSTGGHRKQLDIISEFLSKKGLDVSLLVEEVDSTGASQSNYLKVLNRRKFNLPFVILRNMYTSYKVIKKRNPKYIVSTGAGSTVLVCIIGKLLNKKIIYFESFAKINSKTMSGRICYYISDVFYVQWESMLKHYPKARFKGGLY